MTRLRAARTGTAMALLTVFAVQSALAAPPEPQDAVGMTPRDLTLEDLRAFSDVFNQARKNFVDPVDERALIHAAIRGMLAELDPHSSYLPATAYQELRDVSSGRYGGVGIRLAFTDSRIEVDAIIDGSPADRAGIDLGDVILAIDGEPVRGRALQDAADAVDGEPGTRVQLRVQRPGEPPREVTLERELIKLPTLSYQALSRGWGLFRMSQFHRDSAKDLAAALESIRAGGTDLAGLVLDLRGNPGGVLQPAIEIADGFLESGRIVSTRGRNPTMQMEFTAQPGQWLPGKPLVVLVDRRSASASEVLAGALQDHGRALIVGERTFGKGSVQSVLPLRDGSGIKLTTARYYTPDGRSIQAEGIVPDLAVELADAPSRNAPASGREVDLAGHLPPETATIESVESSDSNGKFPLEEIMAVLAEAGLLAAGNSPAPGKP
jgi:carboxyl-terminal processing protease